MPDAIEPIPSARADTGTPSPVRRPRVAAAALFAAALSAAAPAMAGLPYRTDDATTQGLRNAEFDLFTTYSRFSTGSTATVPSAQLTYGLLENFDLSVTVPYALSQTNGVGTNTGIGDIQFSIKYRFLDEDENGWRPAIAFGPSMTLPSGDSARGLGNASITGFFPVWVSKTLGDWALFGGGGLNVNDAPGQKNWWYAGFGATYQVDETWTVGGEVYYQSPNAVGVKDQVGFNLGLSFTLADKQFLLVSVGRNIINAADTNQFSGFLGYQLKF